MLDCLSGWGLKETDGPLAGEGARIGTGRARAPIGHSCVRTAIHERPTARGYEHR